MKSKEQSNAVKFYFQPGTVNADSRRKVTIRSHEAVNICIIMSIVRINAILIKTVRITKIQEIEKGTNKKFSKCRYNVQLNNLDRL